MPFWQIETGLSGFDTPIPEAMKRLGFVVSEFRDAKHAAEPGEGSEARKILRA